MKAFIITIDTEGDNLWDWHAGEEIRTENSTYIPRFQDLCEKYGFIPTYLTNYEMAKDDRWVSFAKNKAYEGLCEIGMHIHAWNSPPNYYLENRYGGNAYITEYPVEVMRKKVLFLKKLLENRFGTEILSNRSGRWATNDDYFGILVDSGIKFDCSVTPQLDLSAITGYSKNCGNDYRKHPISVYSPVEGLVEIPMTTRKIRRVDKGSLKHRLRTAFVGEDAWLRPFTKSFEELMLLSRKAEKDNNGYLEFMIHSSELMPGGSPYFKDEEDIEVLFSVMDSYFSWVANNGYQGYSLSQYGSKIIAEKCDAMLMRGM